MIRQNATGNYNAQAAGAGASATVNLFTIQLQELGSLPPALLGALAPKIEDLFDFVEDPALVLPMVFRNVNAGGLSADALPLISERQKPLRLYDLLQNHPAVLVLSRAGLGKTREAAETAKTLCGEDWLVCVAKAEGDARLDEPSSFPDNLRQRRVLFVIDDLHQRSASGTTKAKSYLDRLDAFLRFLETRLQPSEMRVLITARSEPKFRQAVNKSHPIWQRFLRVELSEFRPDGLTSGLLAMARQAGIVLDKGLAARLVQNSDKTPRTLIENVRLATKRGTPLTSEKWLPTQQRSWLALFEEAKRKSPRVKSVFEALFLLRSSSVAPRLP
ncbi:MAG: hypothetical protein JO061_21170, partial [Acidobacteriaceae bacterium]|nr:hypothetical protein [Acidobacteriaceae bacterium]